MIYIELNNKWFLVSLPQNNIFTMLQLKKYQIWLLAILSGLLLGISWPVNGFAPLIFIALVPLLLIRTYILHNPKLFSRGAIVLYSYVSFLIFNIFTTWWVIYSTTVGALLAFFLNSLFMALTFGLAHIVDKRIMQTKTGFFILIFFFVSFEYLHMNWELTWSWLNLGNVFSEFTNWVQWYEYTGVLGGSIWVIGVNLILQQAILRWIKYDKKIQYSIIPLSIAIALVAIPISYSYSLKNKTNIHSKNSINVLLIQPNIEPYNEAYELTSTQLVDNILSLTTQYMDTNTELVICPESSINRTVWEENIELYPAIREIRTFIHNHKNICFLMGASTSRMLKEGEDVKAYARSFSNMPNKYYYNYNTALFIKKDIPIEFYHKAKLVPGVERMPFATLLKPVEKFAIDLGGTTGSLGISTSPKLFKPTANTYVAPIICYESIYGEFVSNFVEDKPSFIAVITNDAWWYNSPGYRQHFSYARLRAIESRRFVVRAANTGISGIINSRGEVISKSKFYDKTAIKAKIPILKKWTYYAQHGDYLGRTSVFLSALLVFIAISVFLRRKQIK